MHTLMSNTPLTFIFVVSISLISNTNGFSIDMIPLDSPDVGIIQSNLSSDDRIELLTNITMLRALSYRNRSQGVRPNAIEALTASLPNSFYITQLTIGNYANNHRYQPYVILDTGSDETWLQCEGCDPCFPIQNEERYVHSRSFTVMPPFDPMCSPRREYHGSCGFEIHYALGARVEGYVGREHFRFKNSHTGKMERYRDIAFGCGLHNENIHFVREDIRHRNIVAGVHGLGKGPRSFLTQMDEVINGRFSYCLPPFRSNGQSSQAKMYFGPDAQIRGDASNDVQTISMSVVMSRYHLYLSGITVAGERLDLGGSYCELGYNSGFYIDSGAPYSALPGREYSILKQAMVRYFSQYGWRPRMSNKFKLCYSNFPDDDEDQSFPAVTFHFLWHGGGEIDMDLSPAHIFEAKRNNAGFCMAVLTMDETPCIFGNFQQKDFNFLFDVNYGTLSFVPADCAL